VRVGLVEGVALSSEVADALGRVAGRLRSRGHTVVPVRLASLADAREAGWTILLAEAAAQHGARLARVDALLPETRRLLERGAGVAAASHDRAIAMGQTLRQALDTALSSVDVLLTVTSGAAGARRDDPAGLATLEDRAWRIPFSLTGHPALALSGPLTGRKMPVGLQLIGRRQGDRALLALGRRLESDLATVTMLPWGSSAME